MSIKTEATDSTEHCSSDSPPCTPQKITRTASSASASKPKSSEWVALTDSFNHKLALQDRRFRGQLKQAIGSNVFMLFLVFLGLLVGLVAMGWWSLEKLTAQQAEIRELRGQVHGLVGELRHMERVGISLEAELGNVRQLADKLRNEILDLHMNELIKEERSIHILKKYSSPFSFQVKGNLKDNPHYKAAEYDGNLIRKKDQEISMLVSEQPIPVEGIHYFQFRIQNTLYSMISLGVMSQQVRPEECAYCEAEQMYYFNCNNGLIYHNSYLYFLKDSRESKVQGAGEGDIVTMFMDQEEWYIIWYVNNKYAGSQAIDKKHRGDNMRLFPFIEVTNRGDQIRILL